MSVMVTQYVCFYHFIGKRFTNVSLVGLLLGSIQLVVSYILTAAFLRSLRYTLTEPQNNPHCNVLHKH